ncbi:MAG: helix-turn-helix domain-containing protein [Actinomycetota bacterium]
MNRMVTTGDVARSLGVSINSVKAWIRAGAIRAVRLPSGHYRIPKEELDKLLREAPSIALRRRQWDYAERWSRAQPVEDVAFGEALAWVESMLRIALSRGEPAETPVEETLDHLRHLHRALGRIRS